MVKNVSRAVIKRLPKYHRYLSELFEKGIDKISSRELSAKIGFTASQIRQDFNHFGGFGQQGYGYNVKALLHEISGILGLNKVHKTVIIGAGNLGHALANSTSFEKYGFKLLALFDIDKNLIGTKINGREVIDYKKFEKFVKEHNVDIAYLCTEPSSAQSVADDVVSNGIKAIWNFALVDLEVPDDVIVENVHMIDNLCTISYFLKGL